ncbi:MAG: hypothetical protein JW776_12840 [Candidatus Lokiarchaeota archaeon]|nr:hypothetical protein [Candidatus Lokiarchaeota archaeon]
MNKIVKFFLWGIFIWWIVTFMIFIFISDIPELAMELRSSDKYIPAIFYVVMSIFAFFMMTRMIKKAREQKKVMSEILFGFFLLSAVSGFIQGFFGILQFTVSVLQNFWTSSTYFFVTGSTFMLGFFVIELFFKGLNTKKNKVALITIGIVILISNLGISLNILTDLGDIYLYVPIVLLLISTLGLYGALIYQSFKISRFLDPSPEKSSLIYIGLSGFFLIIGFILVIVYSFTDLNIIRITNAIIFMIGYFLLYWGFTLPSRKT